MNVNDESAFPAGAVRLLSASMAWTWPGWLRWAEKVYRSWRGKYQVSYEFEVEP